jgi:hypothetical protein
MPSSNVEKRWWIRVGRRLCQSCGGPVSGSGDIARPLLPLSRRFLQGYADNSCKICACACGLRKQARARATQDIHKGEEQWITAYEVAVIYALLEDNDNALLWLARAEREHAVGFTFIRVDPHLDNLRNDSRFTDLLARIDNSAAQATPGSPRT